MNARAYIATLIAGLTLLASGCDSFSLLDQFTKGSDSANLTLTAQKTSLLRDEVILLYPVGGTEPYTFGVVAGDLFAGTETLWLGGVDAPPPRFSAGKAIGTIIIQVTDASQHTAQASVTILPPAPTNVLHTRSVDSKAIDISWMYTETSIITGFLLRRTTDNVIFVDTELTATDTVITETNLPPNTIFTYYLTAISGSFSSVPVQIVVPPTP